MKDIDENKSFFEDSDDTGSEKNETQKEDYIQDNFGDWFKNKDEI